MNLGFNQGAELDDPAGLLGGPGRSLRHLRIASTQELADPALLALLVQAREHRETTTHSTSR